MNSPPNYSPDLLGSGYESCIIDLPDDYEGLVRATLIRSLCRNESQTAVFYIHGFNDYFFQKHFAKAINDAGFHFYAIDLRKYGRSHLPHQKWFNMRDVSEYYPELDEAIRIMKSEGIQNIILNPHSTGGLILGDYLNNRNEDKYIKAVLFNSPFLEFNENWLSRKVGVPILAFLGKNKPDKLLQGGLDENYGKSIYKGDLGDWDYNLSWKNNQLPAVNYGWIRAIYLAQIRLKKSGNIQIPVVIFSSDKSYQKKEWSDEIHKADAVLNVKHIWKFGKRLGRDVQTEIIPGGKHDLALSFESVRKLYFEILIEKVRAYSS